MAEAFGVWLQKQLDDAGMSASDLAHQIRRTPSTVYQWLSNETRPNDENANRLARVLRLDKGVVHQALNRFKLVDVSDPEIRDILALYTALPPQSRRLASRLLHDLQEHQESDETSAGE